MVVDVVVDGSGNDDAERAAATMMRRGWARRGRDGRRPEISDGGVPGEGMESHVYCHIYLIGRERGSRDEVTQRDKFLRKWARRADRL